MKNAAGHVTRYEDYDAFGNTRKITDPNNVVTTATYDPLGRLLTSTVKGVTGCSTSADPICRNDLTSTRTYEPATGPLKSETRPGGGATVYGYDTRGRVSTVSRGPTANDLRERIEYQYDPATGKKSVERMLAFEGASWVEKKRENYTYDSFSRLRRSIHPDSTFIEYEYEAGGNLSTTQDENHSRPNTRYAHDPASRLTEQTYQSFCFSSEGTAADQNSPPRANANGHSARRDSLENLHRRVAVGHPEPGRRIAGLERGNRAATFDHEQISRVEPVSRIGRLTF